MFVRIAAIIVFWVSGFAAAHADWVEARSENFIFVGNTSEKKAKLIVSELEEYRTILFKVMRINPAPELVPVRIYGVKSTKAIRKMTGATSASGVYKTTYEGPVFVADISGSFSKDSWARKVVYHEYAHHIVATYTDTIYPTWFNEGLAEYLSTFEVDKNGLVNVGLPSDDRAYAIAGFGWMDMDVFLGAIRGYPYANDRARQTLAAQQRFYAQSWLAVHYIYNNRDYAGKLNDYLAAIAREDVSDTVFSDSFGTTPESFGDLLSAYLKKNQYRYLKVTLRDYERNAVVKTRKLNAGETYFERGEAVRRFQNGGKDGALSEEYYARALKEGDGPRAQIEASRAYVAIENGDEAAALNHIEKALAEDASDSRILWIAGHIYLGLYTNKETLSDSAQIKKAQSFLMQAMRANPRNISAHYDYVSTFAVTRGKISKQAIYSALECASYYKSLNFIDGNMKLVKVLVKNGKNAEAKYLLEKALIWSDTDQVRTYAKAMLEQVSR